MTIDIAATPGTYTANGPHYVSARQRITYRAKLSSRTVSVHRRSANIVVRDMQSGTEGTGPTYLDAIWALDRARRSDS